MDNTYGLGERVEELMRKSPKWKPARQNGKPVRSYHTQPITLVINSDEAVTSASSFDHLPTVDAGELRSRNIRDLIQANQNDEIISFSMKIDTNKGDVVTIDHAGNELSTGDKNFLDQYVKPGHIMTIDAIRVKRNGKTTKLLSKIYRL